MAKLRDTYGVYSRIYDDLKGDRSSTVELIDNFISRYSPDTKTILELACGTGEIIKGLRPKYSYLEGLDSSPAMLRIAAKKLPGVDFRLEDMVDFDLDRSFDTILCLHNSFNHVLELTDIIRFFQRVQAHLEPEGIFICDLNTPERMDLLSSYGASVLRVGNDLSIVQVLKDNKDPGAYHWNQDILIHEKRNNYTMHKVDVPIAAFPLNDIRAALQLFFEVVEEITMPEESSVDDRGRIYLICRRLAVKKKVNQVKAI